MNKISIEKNIFHLMSLEELHCQFNVDLNRGLSSSEAAHLQSKHGRNQIAMSYLGLLKVIVIDLFDRLSLLLWFALIATVLTYEPTGNPPQISALITALCLLLNLFAKAFLTTLQAYNGVKSIRAAEKSREVIVNVLRDGQMKSIDSIEITIGDLVYLEPYQRVPADMRLVFVDGMALDRSELTGETELLDVNADKYPVESNVEYPEAANMAFTNSRVAHGHGIGLVVALCTHSHFGSLKNLSSSNKHYQASGGVINEMARFIGAIVCLCLICAFIYIVFYFIFIRPNFSLYAKDVINGMLAVAISGVPFGLPISVTLALFLVSRELKKGKILVKNVFAIDSANSIDVLITDKTGTLTWNKLKVHNVFIGSQEIDIDSCEIDANNTLGINQSVKELLALCHFNNNKITMSSSLDLALFDFFRESTKGERVGLSYKQIEEIEFNSSTKYHVKLLEPLDAQLFREYFNRKNQTNEKESILMVKGAPEVLLSRCSYIIELDGSENELTLEKRSLILNKFTEWSMRGIRVLVLCRMILPSNYFILNGDEFSSWFKFSCTNQLTFVSLLGFVDPPKSEVRECIRGIRNLGVRVVMATGDFSLTAKSIAKAVGILTSDYYDSIDILKEPNRIRRSAILLSGSEIDTLTKLEWRIICREYYEIILCRTTPQQKLTAVKEFQSNDCEVLMAGDGANDIPALKSANLSVAMGSGNRTAANLSDIVLLDNNFTYIYKLFLTGKQTFDNIKKIFLLFSIVSVFGEVFSSFLSALIGFPNPYSNYSVIIISIITDTVTSLTYIYDPPKLDTKTLKQRKERLVDWRLLVQGLLIRGPFTMMLVYANFIIYINLYTSRSVSEFLFDYKFEFDTQHQLTFQSISLYTTVCMQSFGNLFAIKYRKYSIFDFWPFMETSSRNYPMAISVFLTTLFVVLVINLPIDGTYGSIPWLFYALPFCYSLLIVVLNEIILFLTVRFRLFRRFLSW